MTYTGEAAAPVVRDVAGAPALDPTAEGRAWVDVDGDALPDLLDGEPGAWRMRRNIGGQPRGDLDHARVARGDPLGPKARFADLTGDGVQDLLAEQSPGELWSYVGGGADPFGHAEPTPLDLSFDLSDPRVALADMNADGRVDVLRHDDEDGWIWLRRRDGAATRRPRPSRRRPPGCGSATRACSSPTWTATASPISSASSPRTAASSSRPARASASSTSPPTCAACRRCPRRTASSSPT
jgi:hypothetical protein